MGGAVEGAHGPVGRRLAAVAAHVGTGQGGAIEGGSPARLGPEGGIHAHAGRPCELPEPRIGIVIVLEGAAAAARVAGVAAQPRGEVHVLQVGPRDAGIARASGALRQSAGAGVAGAAGARIRAWQGGVRQLVALLAERGRRGGRGPRVGMAGGAVGGEGRGGHGHVSVAAAIGHAAQEGDGVGRHVVVVAEGGVVAARLGAGRRGNGGVAGRIHRRTREVALGADGGIGGVGGHMREGGPRAQPPGLRRMGGAHPVTAGAGVGGGATGEVLVVADLAGGQARAGGPGDRPLGAQSVAAWIGEAGSGLVMAPGGQTGGHAAADPEDGELVALGAGTDAGHGLAAMHVHPAGWVVVPVVLGGVGRALGAAAPQEAQETEHCRHRDGMPLGSLILHGPHP